MEDSELAPARFNPFLRVKSGLGLAGAAVDASIGWEEGLGDVDEMSASPVTVSGDRSGVDSSGSSVVVVGFLVGLVRPENRDLSPGDGETLV